MGLTEIIQNRYSVRAFLDKPVPQETLDEVFKLAGRAASNCNVQPWQTIVISGDAKNKVSKQLVELVAGGATPNSDFPWHMKFDGKHKERQFGAANALYGAMDVDRHDREARTVNMLRNWSFFDAPHAVYFSMEKYLGYVGAVDMGIYAQTLSLLLRERGIDCCMQGALGMYPTPVREFCQMPEDVGILFGMSMGYADPDAAANQARTDRVELDQAVTYLS